MKPQYIILVGTTPVIVPLNNNAVQFDVSIRAGAGVTVEVALEDVAPTVPANEPGQGSPGPTWVAPPNAVNANGVLHLTGAPYRLVRLTPTTGGTATILQQGLI